MNAAEEAPGPSHQGSGVVVRGKFRPARGLVAKVRPEATAPPGRHRRTRGERLARQLALAHWIDRAVESGQVASYGEVARVLGLTESRITQVTALLGLSPAQQEAVLLGEGGIGIREAIRVGREAKWRLQEKVRGAAGHSTGPQGDDRPGVVRAEYSNTAEMGSFQPARGAYSMNG